MTCSEINFVSSQHFYGLCIALQSDLPSLDATDEKWMAALSKLNRLAKISAQQQIDSNKEAPGGS
jgi:hypothetical protein